MFAAIANKTREPHARFPGIKIIHLLLEWLCPGHNAGHLQKFFSYGYFESHAEGAGSFRICRTTNIRTPYTDIYRLSAYVKLRRYHDYRPVYRYP